DWPWLDRVAILTVVSIQPDSGDFRPGYVGTGVASNYNTSDIDWDAVHSDLAAVASTPTLATVAGYFARPWLELNLNWTGNRMNPADNMPRYGRDMAHRVNAAALRLQLSDSQPEKTAAMVNFLQYGIDLYEILQAGGNWYADGGVNVGRKLPVLFAGKVLGDAGMLAYADKAQYFRFQEDHQTFYVEQFDIDQTKVVYPGKTYTVVQYEPVDLSLPEWGIRHSSETHRQYDNRNWVTDYRTVAGAPMPGSALVAHMMGLQDEWGWDSFFDYCDRYYQIESGGHSSGTNSIQDFVYYMWEDYRNVGAPTGSSKVVTPTISPSTGSYDSTQSTTITSSNADTIYYTLDGTTPDTGDTVYSSAFDVEATTTVKAYGVGDGLTDSDVQTSVITIGCAQPAVS
ncbi:MAG: chitobiase/beta-hexosaminidase C-terminal domain-containing protein, partial [Natronospirillum sp.]